MAYTRRDLDRGQKVKLGNNLRNARKQRGLLGKAAAKALKVMPTQISFWELGRTAVELPRLLDLAALYGVSLDNLLMGIHPGYDEVVKKRLPLNVQRYIDAQIETVRVAVRHADADLVEQLMAGAEPPTAQPIAPTAVAPPARPQKRDGTPDSTRGRRIVKKGKTRRRRDVDSPS